MTTVRQRRRAARDLLAELHRIQTRARIAALTLASLRQRARYIGRLASHIRYGSK